MAPRMPKMPQSQAIPSHPEPPHSLKPKQLDEIAELTGLYLPGKADAFDFSEESIVSSLAALYWLSRQESSKMKKAHAKKVQKIVLGAQATTPQENPNGSKITAPPQSQRAQAQIPSHDVFISDSVPSGFLVLSQLYSDLKSTDLSKEGLEKKTIIINNQNMSLYDFLNESKIIVDSKTVSLFDHFSEMKRVLVDRLEGINKNLDVDAYNEFAKDISAQNQAFYLIRLVENIERVGTQFVLNSENAMAEVEKSYFERLPKGGAEEANSFMKDASNASSNARMQTDLKIRSTTSAIMHEINEMTQQSLFSALLYSNPKEFNQGEFSESMQNAVLFDKYVFTSIIEATENCSAVAKQIGEASSQIIAQANILDKFFLKLAGGLGEEETQSQLSKMSSAASSYVMNVYELGLMAASKSELFYAPTQKHLQPEGQAGPEKAKKYFDWEIVYEGVTADQAVKDFLKKYTIEPVASAIQDVKEKKAEYDAQKLSYFNAYLSHVASLEGISNDLAMTAGRALEGHVDRGYDALEQAKALSLATNTALTIASFFPRVGSFATGALIALGMTDEGIAISNEIKAGKQAWDIFTDHSGSLALYTFMAFTSLPGLKNLYAAGLNSTNKLNTLFNTNMNYSSLARLGIDGYFVRDLSLAIYESGREIANVAGEMGSGKITEQEARIQYMNLVNGAVVSAGFLAHTTINAGKTIKNYKKDFETYKNFEATKQKAESDLANIETQGNVIYNSSKDSNIIGLPLYAKVDGKFVPKSMEGTYRFLQEVANARTPEQMGKIIQKAGSRSEPGALVEKKSEPPSDKKMALIKKYLNETEDYLFKFLIAEGESYEKYEWISAMLNESNRRVDVIVEKTGNFAEAAEFCIEKANKRYVPKLKKGWELRDEDGLAAHMKEFWREKASYYYSKAGEKYEKEGKFREAGEMFYAAAYNAIDFDQKLMFYEKSGENYEKSGNFKEAAEMFYATFKDSSEQVKNRNELRLRMEQNYSKAIENFERIGNFREAFKLCTEAGILALDPSKQQAFYSKAAKNCAKAEQDYVTSGNFKEAREMYSDAVLIFSSEGREVIRELAIGDPKLPVEKKSEYESKSKIYSAFAAALEVNPGERDFLIFLASKFRDPFAFTADVNKETFVAALDKYAAQENSEITDIGGFSVKVLEEKTWKPLEKPGGRATVDIFLIKNEKGKLNIYANAAVKDVLDKIPARYMPIFIEEALGKKDVFSKLSEKQLPEAFNRIKNRIETESKEFERKLISGEKIDANYAKYLYCVVSKVESSDFAESVIAVAKKLGLENRKITPALFEELYMTANEQLKPPFLFPTETYSINFLARQVDASVPADAIKSAAIAIKNSMDAFALEKITVDDLPIGIRERCGEILKISEIQDQTLRKEKISDLLPENKRKTYIDGKMTDENAIRLILKKNDIGDLSWVFWDIASKLPEAEVSLLEKASKNEPLGQAETNYLVQIVNKFNVYLEEYLLGNKFSVLEPSIKATPVFREFAIIREKVTEVASKQASENVDLKLVFGQENRLLDIFAGSFSGNCLGDNPAFSLARKDVAIATIYKGWEPAGAAFFLLRNINGKDSLVLFGIDFSESLTGSKDAGTMLSTEKVNELTKWMEQCIQEYANASGFGLYVTDKGGQISNDKTARSELLRHFGNDKISFEKSGKLHEEYGYNMYNAYGFAYP